MESRPALRQWTETDRNGPKRNATGLTGSQSLTDFKGLTVAGPISLRGGEGVGAWLSAWRGVAVRWRDAGVVLVAVVVAIDFP